MTNQNNKESVNNILKNEGCLSVSEGTLRNQDLIPRFIDVLKYMDESGYDDIVCGSDKLPIIPSYAKDDMSDNWWDSQEAYDLYVVLENAINESAPDGFYFGSNEGDGESIGFWPVES